MPNPEYTPAFIKKTFEEHPDAEWLAVDGWNATCYLYSGEPYAEPDENVWVSRGYLLMSYSPCVTLPKGMTWEQSKVNRSDYIAEHDNQ